MPGRNPSPRVALMGAFDARPWRGNTAVFTRDTGGVEIAVPADAGVYEDVPAFLFGRGSQVGRSLSEDFKAGWIAKGGGGSIDDVDVDLGADDIITLRAGAPFALQASADNDVWGFTTSLYGSDGSGPYYISGIKDWRRALVDKSMTITPGGGTGSFSLPSGAYRAQNPITVLRSPTTVSDVDMLSATLETWDNDAADPTDRRIRWGQDDTGHVFTAYPSAVADIDLGGTGFEQSLLGKLGYDGTETVTISGGLTVLTAHNICPVCYFPSRGLVRPPQRGLRETTNTLIGMGGKVFVNPVNSLGLWTIDYLADGPADAGNGLAGDTSSHLIENFYRLVRKGMGLNVYCQWPGELRRGIRFEQIGLHQRAYTTVATSEYDGLRGRLRCVRSPDDSDPALAWPKTTRKRLPVQLLLMDRVD